MSSASKIGAAIFAMTFMVVLTACTEQGAPPQVSTPTSQAPLVQAQTTAQEPAHDSRYVIQGDTVYDKKTDLTWSRCSAGQQWKESIGCVGVIMHLTWSEAQTVAGNGWRIPSPDELLTLSINSRGSNRYERIRMDRVAFPDMEESDAGGVYWSSSESVEKPIYMFFFERGDGFLPGIHIGRDEYKYLVRLVRGGDQTTGQAPNIATTNYSGTASSNQRQDMQTGSSCRDRYASGGGMAESDVKAYRECQEREKKGEAARDKVDKAAATAGRILDNAAKKGGDFMGGYNAKK